MPAKVVHRSASREGGLLLGRELRLASQFQSDNGTVLSGVTRLLPKAGIVMPTIAVVAFLAGTTLLELWAIGATVFAAVSAVAALFLFTVNRSRPAN
jgi:hypothetical protein